MEPLFLCEWCDKSFVRKYNLEKHINISKKCIELRKSRMVDCDYCGVECDKIDIDDHLQSCAAYYKNLYDTTKTNLTTEITKEQKKVRILTSKNKKLELELAEAKGRLLQLSQQPMVNINNSNNNKTISYITKIKQLPVKNILPLTDEFIDSFIIDKYTFEVFYGRYPAILEWFKQFFSLKRKESTNSGSSRN
jgi:hypothetical protein